MPDFTSASALTADLGAGHAVPIVPNDDFWHQMNRKTSRAQVVITATSVQLACPMTAEHLISLVWLKEVQSDFDWMELLQVSKLHGNGTQRITVSPKAI